jgi:hypothetical protein
MWDDLVRLWADNREVDIARFLTRILTRENIEVIKQSLGEFADSRIQIQQTDDEMIRFLSLSRDSAEQRLGALNIEDIGRMGFFEVSVEMQGSLQNRLLDLNFYALTQQNKRIVSWEFWASTRNANVNLEAYEGVEQNVEQFHLGLWRAKPDGKLYTKRYFAEDLSGNFPIGEVFDFDLPIVWVASAMIGALDIASQLKQPNEIINLSFQFRWVGLENRRLTAWANRNRAILAAFGGGSAIQNECETRIDVPDDVSMPALPSFILEAIRPLFQLFEGRRIDLGSVEVALRAARIFL